MVFRLWCSTENDHGYHRRLGSKWAYCGQDCPRDKDEKCKVNGKTSHPHYIAQEKPTFDYVEYEENKSGHIFSIYDLISFRTMTLSLTMTVWLT